MVLTLFLSYPRQPWIKYINADNQPYATAEAIDLLDNLLRYDHMERLTAKEAQGHIYFSERLLSASVVLSSSFHATFEILVCDQRRIKLHKIVDLRRTISSFLWKLLPRFSFPILHSALFECRDRKH